MTDPCLVAMRGIVPSLNTPFTADDRIDEAGVASLVDATVNAGVAGMLILAVAGEQGSLSAAEKEQVGRIIVARTQHRIPVVMSVTAPEVQVSRDLAAVARAIEAGVDAGDAGVGAGVEVDRAVHGPSVAVVERAADGADLVVTGREQGGQHQGAC